MAVAISPNQTCKQSPCVDAGRCEACDECMPLLICPARAFERVLETSQVQVTDLTGCYGCRACVTACFEEAVRWF
jgi:uncharacterized Fe-S center protein